MADEVAADTSSSSYDANGESGADDEDEEDLNSIEDLSHDGEQVRDYFVLICLVGVKRLGRQQ